MRGSRNARSKTPPSRRSLWALPSLLLAACFSPGEGLPPPVAQVYFPVGLAQNTDATRLFVVNSDFDLQFNAGTLQTYDLVRMAEVVPKVCAADADCAAGQRCDLEPSAENSESPSHFCVAETGDLSGRPCGAFGERPAADKLLYPGRCNFIEPSAPQDGGPSLIVDAVTIGAFATDVIFRARPADVQGQPGRLFVPVRGDATLHWIDVDADGRLACGQGNNSGACDDLHRAGDDADQENTRDLRLGPEPFGIDAPVDGVPIAVTNQTTGTTSLFVNDWQRPDGPQLEFALTGLPTRPIGVASIPEPELSRQNRLLDPTFIFRPGFLVTFRDSPEVRLLRVFDDQGAEDTNPLRPFLVSVGVAPIFANSVGTDSRGIAIDASQRRAAEAACEGQADPVSCLQGAAAVPLRVFVANRTPASLLVGRTRSTAGNLLGDDLPYFFSSIPLSPGPSRVVVGNILNAAGERELRVFVVCFDSRRIYVYDPDLDRVELEITTGRGPHALSIDDQRALAYVGHFTDSFIGVINLDQRVPGLYGALIATVGRPTPPRASK